MSGYINGRSARNKIQALSSELENQQVNAGVRIEDAASILKEAAYSVDRGYEAMRAYAQDKQQKKDRNFEMEHGAIYSFVFDEWSMGSELRSVHPAVCFTANWMRNSDTIVCIPTTSATSRRNRILEKRQQPKDSWDDEAWCSIPVESDPPTDEPRFIDLKQIRCISPARVQLLDGKANKLATLTPACIQMLEEAIMVYFNMKSYKEVQQHYHNTLDAKRASDKKSGRLWKCLKSVQSSLQTLKDNPSIDPQHTMGELLKEITEALKD